MTNPIEIIFQNSQFVVVNKPEGVSVHNNEDAQNLLGLLEAQLSVEKLYPVHRLDKETSGVQILALGEESAKVLSEEFQKKTVQKIYRAVLRGALKSKTGIWNQTLTDKAEGRSNPAGMNKQRIACETRYSTIKESPFFTMIEAELITGRQHQIRKHTALTNHPIVGDSRYGDPRYNKKMADFYHTDRMFLHCARVVLQGQVFEAPVPTSFELLFSEIKN